jgi:hypothetical protein
MFTKKKKNFDLWMLISQEKMMGLLGLPRFQSAAPVTTGKTWQVKRKLRRTRTYHGFTGE